MVKTVDQLVNEYSGENILATYKLKFTGVNGYDVYNPTSPFLDNGKKVLAGRVEKRDTEKSKVMFFEQINEDTWKLIDNLPTFDLQDPYFTLIGGKLVLGGTQVFDHPDIPDALWWRAEKLVGNDIDGLEHLVYGPNGMKDIRICEVNNKILVLTRPQGEKGGRGRIGYYFADNLADITVEKIEEAPLLDLCISEEWVGSNQAMVLKNGKVGVLGHIAKFDENGGRHYYPTTFCFDPETAEYTDMKIICMREYLDEGESKRPDLYDVMFSGGIVRNEDGTAELYTGVGDCEVHCVKIQDPFLEYEGK
ncbi:DUF1861 family protein [Neobacillus rhizosphaerae]|uniref:DUF1861 family protein n=1 Tax=Neobacillus rhizosphaerae TaxID=2880965 RepID=UPI003D2B6A3D